MFFESVRVTAKRVVQSAEVRVRVRIKRIVQSEGARLKSRTEGGYETRRITKVVVLQIIIIIGIKIYLSPQLSRCL
jgi:hypothetical protein